MLLAENLLWILTAVVMIVALAIIKRSLDAETRVLANIKEMSLHMAAFVIFALCCALMVTFFFVLGNNKSTAAAVTIVDVMIICTVLDSVCGLILMYIFCKIYIVVKESSSQNSQVESFEAMISNLSDMTINTN